MKKLIIFSLLILLVGCEKVVDDENITVELNPGYDIVGINTEWNDAGCSLNVNDNLTIDMDISSNNIEITEFGEYTVIYLEEYNSIEYNCTRIVKVIDVIAPLVELNPGIDTIILGEEWIDAGITATDDYDINLFITVTGTVDINTIGSYAITYTVIDYYMNKTIVTRIINVIELG